MTRPKNFNETLHLMRGIGMCLVVYGHVLGATSDADSSLTWTKSAFAYVYSFHMPMFFFISGYFGRKMFEYTPGTYGTTLLRLGQRLGVVYLFYTATAIAMKLAVPGLSNRQIVWGEMLKDVLVYPNLNPMLSLWFIYTLLMVQVLFFTLNALLRPDYNNRQWRIGWLTVLIGLYLSRRFMPSEFGISYFCAYGLFFYLGYLASRTDQIELLLKRYRVRLFIVALLWIPIGHAYSAELFYQGVPTPFTLIYACVGIIIVWAFALYLSERGGLLTRFFSWIGDYAYEIYLNSPFFQLPMMRLYAKLGLSMTAAFPVFLVAALLLPIPLTIYVLRRFRLLRRLACGDWSS